MCSQGGARLALQHHLRCHLRGLQGGAEHQHARRPTSGGPRQSVGAHHRWDVLRNIGGADIGGDAPPKDGLHRHLQWVHRWLEPGGHPCAQGKLAVTRIVGGRASLRAVGDGCLPCERG